MSERNIDLHFRVNKDELRMIELRAKKNGFTTKAAYLRKNSIDGKIIHVDMSEVIAIKGLLIRCSNNINQMTKVVHSNGDLFLEDIQYVQEQLNELLKKQDMLLEYFTDIR